MRRRAAARAALDVEPGERLADRRAAPRARRREGDDLVPSAGRLDQAGERAADVVADARRGCESGLTSKAILTADTVEGVEVRAEHAVVGAARDHVARARPSARRRSGPCSVPSAGRRAARGSVAAAVRDARARCRRRRRAITVVCRSANERASPRERHGQRCRRGSARASRSTTRPGPRVVRVDARRRRVVARRAARPTPPDASSRAAGRWRDARPSGSTEPSAST